MNPYPKYISVTYYQLFSSQSNYLPSMELSNKSKQLFIYFSILQILEISQEKQSDVTSLKRYVQGELPQILFFSLYTLTMSKNIFQTDRHFKFGQVAHWITTEQLENVIFTELSLIAAMWVIFSSHEFVDHLDLLQMRRCRP